MGFSYFVGIKPMRIFYRTIGARIIQETPCNQPLNQADLQSSLKEAIIV